MSGPTKISFESPEYKRCHEQGHQFQSMCEVVDFENYDATFECVVCGSQVEVSGDIRTHDGRHLGWVMS